MKKKILPERELLESAFLRNISVIKRCDSIKGCKTVWIKPKEQISEAQEPQGAGASSLFITPLPGACACEGSCIPTDAPFIMIHYYPVAELEIWESKWGTAAPAGVVLEMLESFYSSWNTWAPCPTSVCYGCSYGNNVNNCNAMADNGFWCGFDWQWSLTWVFQGSNVFCTVWLPWAVPPLLSWVQSGRRGLGRVTGTEQQGWANTGTKMGQSGGCTDTQGLWGYCQCFPLDLSNRAASMQERTTPKISFLL